MKDEEGEGGGKGEEEEKEREEEERGTTGKQTHWEGATAFIYSVFYMLSTTPLASILTATCFSFYIPM